MKKMKCITILISIMLVTVISATTVNAQVIGLDGTVDVEIKDFAGGVAPRLNVTEEQTIYVDLEEVDGNFSVNSTLQIPINVLDNSNRPDWLPYMLGRGFILLAFCPLRGIPYMDIPLKPMMPIKGLFSRFFPIFSYSIVNCKEGFLSKTVDDSVNISLNYDIDHLLDDESPSVGLIASENISVNLITMGLPVPANTNGGYGMHFISTQKVNLTVNYYEDFYVI